jgi:hypothetical protein
MLIPVPLEVISMLQMFKSFAENSKNAARSPLLEMLLPHFEEIFDEIETESVVLTAQSQNTDFKHKNQRKDIVEIESKAWLRCLKGESDPLPDLLTGLRAVTAIIVEWKSSPTGKALCCDVHLLCVHVLIDNATSQSISCTLPSPFSIIYYSIALLLSN